MLCHQLCFPSTLIIIFCCVNYVAATKGGAAKETAKKDKKKDKAPEDKKKKEEKKKEQEEPAEEPDAAEALLAAEPKSKDPFDEMPKGYVSLHCRLCMLFLFRLWNGFSYTVKIKGFLVFLVMGSE